MKRIFSGIQPSGVLHLGNYLGAIKQFVSSQDEPDTDRIFCIVDLHAITIAQDPEELKKNILSVAAMYLACGINPEKSTIFVQSNRPEVAELAIILNCFTNMGELERMTQFKDKSGENQKSVSAGLFDYPVLMAADILLYQTTDVPVGEDQKQHVEITRDIAERVNNRYATKKGTYEVAAGSDEKQIFTVPNPQIKKETAPARNAAHSAAGGRIMGLDDPTKKMAKSAASSLNYIALTDSADIIRDKIKRAVTDSGSEIRYRPDPSGTGPAEASKPAISNLLTIFSGVSGKSISELEQEFEGKNYSDFKTALAEAIIAFLAPIQEKYNDLMADPDKLRSILNAGATKLEPIAQKTLTEVKERIGLG